MRLDLCLCVCVCFTLFLSRSFGFSLSLSFSGGFTHQNSSFFNRASKQRVFSASHRNENLFFPFLEKEQLFEKTFFCSSRSTVKALFTSRRGVDIFKDTRAPIGKGRQNTNTKQRTKHVTLRDIRRANRKTGDCAVRPRV